MTRWQYTSLVAQPGQEGPLLAKAGEDGWELVTMLAVPVATSRLATKPDGLGFMLVFKRPDEAARKDVSNGNGRAEFTDGLRQHG